MLVGISLLLREFGPHKITLISTCAVTIVTLNVVVECSTLLLRIRKVPGLNVGPETGYPEFFMVFSVTPGKYRNGTLN
jgi:hypothetical protein